MCGLCGWILFSRGSRVGFDASFVKIVWFVPSVPIFLHMKFSESSVKFSRFLPSVVSAYTFLGLSVCMSQSLFTYPFSSSLFRRG